MHAVKVEATEGNWEDLAIGSNRRAAMEWEPWLGTRRFGVKIRGEEIGEDVGRVEFEEKSVKRKKVIDRVWDQQTSGASIFRDQEVDESMELDENDLIGIMGMMDDMSIEEEIEDC